MKKLKVLNLYAGLGGNRKLWLDCEVTAVELDPRIAEVYASQHPEDKIILEDAHQYLLDHYSEFDFVWTSPPCQKNSRMGRSGKHKKPRYPGLELYAEIIFLKSYFKKGLWVVENVNPWYEPLIRPSVILDRHFFWSNFKIDKFEAPKFPGGIMQKQNIEHMRKMQDWLGIHYEKPIYYGDNHSPSQVLANCVHPETGLHIFNCARGILNRPVNNASQMAFDLNAPSILDREKCAQKTCRKLTQST